MSMRVVGIDLAGVEDRETGFCVLDLGLRATTRILHTDEEVIGACLDARLRAVAIDAPLALPKGRESLEERSDVHMRACDRELLRTRSNSLPSPWGP